MRTGRQTVGRFGPRRDGPRFQVGRPADSMDGLDQVVDVTGEFQASDGPGGLGLGDDRTIGESGQHDDRSGPARTPFQPLGPARLEHRDLPDRQHPLREGPRSIPGSKKSADLLIVDRLRPIASRRKDIGQCPAQFIIATSHLDPERRRHGPGTSAFAPLEQAGHLARAAHRPQSPPRRRDRPAPTIVPGPHSGHKG